ncbi:hypothetical protein EK21DRAFT_110981 [Setomelanomma holmii]|uniref:Uncharacterized protein n=1 Tax=Setomelanomma holmii TaxID=210430 RepID=A0A9P4LQ01_9PLEO|nr:hypothetical protein EK21DRAFT_110981 [Setomelanomma holmii]
MKAVSTASQIINDYRHTPIRPPVDNELENDHNRASTVGEIREEEQKISGVHRHGAKSFSNNFFGEADWSSRTFPESRAAPESYDIVHGRAGPSKSRSTTRGPNFPPSAIDPISPRRSPACISCLNRYVGVEDCESPFFRGRSSTSAESPTDDIIDELRDALQEFAEKIVNLEQQNESMTAKYNDSSIEVIKMQDKVDVAEREKEVYMYRIAQLEAKVRALEEQLGYKEKIALLEKKVEMLGRLESASEWEHLPSVSEKGDGA